jgi:hypothetical protein
MDLLGKMPHTPSSFAEQYEFYRDIGMLKEWRMAFCEYTWICERPYRKELKDYIAKSIGERDQQRILEEKKKIRKDVRPVKVRMDEAIEREKKRTNTLNQ